MTENLISIIFKIQSNHVSSVILESHCFFGNHKQIFTFSCLQQSCSLIACLLTSNIKLKHIITMSRSVTKAEQLMDEEDMADRLL